MKKRANQLDFLYRIEGDGSRTIPIDPKQNERLQSNNYLYELRCLSITNQTWITSSMSSYVVRIKDVKNNDELVRFGQFITNEREHRLEELAREFREQEEGQKI